MTRTAQAQISPKQKFVSLSIIDILSPPSLSIFFLFFTIFYFYFLQFSRGEKRCVRNESVLGPTPPPLP